MSGKTITTVCVYFMAVAVLSCQAARPLGGRFAGDTAITQNIVGGSEVVPATDCRSLTLNRDAIISLKMKGAEAIDNNVTMTIRIMRALCANEDCREFGNIDLKDSVVVKILKTYKYNLPLSTASEVLIGSMPRHSVKTKIHSVKTKRDDGDDIEGKGGVSTSSIIVTPTPSLTPPPPTNATTTPPPTTTSVDNTTVYRTNESGLFILSIETAISKADVYANITFELHMKNSYGYLSAIDYPALVFYSLMMVVYAALGIAWSISLCCSYKDLVRLQFWVFAVIILGFLEKIFFVSEYGSINNGEEPSFLILLAESISAVKRALARVLLIIVCLGFGTVKPRLGDSLMKVIAVGVVYWAVAMIDGFVRSRADTYDTGDRPQMVTMALLFIMDSIIFYWSFISLVSVRRTLRLRKNYVKLAMYNHFGYTLIFSLIATLAFTLWVFIKINFPQGGCLEDWQEVWLKDCFWHFLFCVILIVIMIIWRPSANRNRFAYSLVKDLDQEDEDMDEGLENKNFETVKMRTVSRGDAGTPPPPLSSSQAEDDLRWVEENLPTTAMDKALPLILDSDEEVMSTKFEASKMN